MVSHAAFAAVAYSCFCQESDDVAVAGSHLEHFPLAMDSYYSIVVVVELDHSIEVDMVPAFFDWPIVVPEEDIGRDCNAMDLHLDKVA